MRVKLFAMTRTRFRYGKPSNSFDRASCEIESSWKNFGSLTWHVDYFSHQYDESYKR